MGKLKHTFSCFQDPFFFGDFMVPFLPVLKTFSITSSPPPSSVILLRYRQYIHQGPPSPSLLFRIMLRQSFLSLSSIAGARDFERCECKRSECRGSEERHPALFDDMSRNKRLTSEQSPLSCHLTGVNYAFTTHTHTLTLEQES